MSSNATSRLEAWLVFAGMLAFTAWYAWPQFVLSRDALRFAIDWLLGGGGG
jgi:hypothetical protein